jgi:hypothetical protein
MQVKNLKLFLNLHNQLANYKKVCQEVTHDPKYKRKNHVPLGCMLHLFIG